MQRSPVNMAIPDNNTYGVTQSFNMPDDLRVETVELILNVNTSYAGDLRITLNSPQGMESILAESRTDPTQNYTDYIFTSRRHWDEHAAGQWIVNLSDRRPANIATWVNYRLRIYGTPFPLPGDLNCDGVVNPFDIDPFILALTDQAGYVAMYPTCSLSQGDLNSDGVVNPFDIQPFIDALLPP